MNSLHRFAFYKILNTFSREVNHALSVKRRLTLQQLYSIIYYLLFKPLHFTFHLFIYNWIFYAQSVLSFYL